MNTPVITAELSLTDIYVAAQLIAENPDLFTQAQLNWLIKMRHKNGLADCGAIFLVSRKVYIHKPLFLEWFMNQRA